MFNKCLFHLCDCMCSNVICILNCLMINPKKIFKYFICFWKCFYDFVYLEFCPNSLFPFRSKTLPESFSRVSREQALLVKLRMAKFRHHWNSDRDFRDWLASKGYRRNLSMCFSGHFASNITRSLLAKWAILQFLKPNSDIFQTYSFCLLCASLNPKHIFSQKLTQNSRSIPPKTHLRYVLTSFYF